MDDNIEVDMPIQNIMEKALRSTETQTPFDPSSMEVALAIRERNAIVEKFLSDDDLKTQVNKTERQNLPLVYILADEPFYSTREFYRKYKTMDEYETKIKPLFVINELKTWADSFIRLGLAENREGRKEDKDAIGAMFSQEISMRTDKGGNNGLGKI